jgi:1-deoxy-D-xylulose-5-phosphate reductoisomerase
MGRKISVDSATMMNKGLELIEAHYLFGLDADQIKVLIHPQSVIHSMVRYVDGSVIAQLGQPDMKTPIAYGLGWPHRIHAGVESLDFMKLKDLTFEEADTRRFPCLNLAVSALKTGGCMPTVLNAANEMAVSAFLNNELRFTEISRVVEQTLNQFKNYDASSLEVILEADQMARGLASQVMKEMSS